MPKKKSKEEETVTQKNLDQVRDLLEFRLEILEIEMIDLRARLHKPSKTSLWLERIKSINTKENRLYGYSFLLLNVSVGFFIYYLIFM
tara:strand:+ start:27713 stop:27976 length:264 start_codon:yes stop_codon:yes gene_type:complete